MAFLFERDKSVFWWVSYRHPETGKRIRESTGFRRDLHKDTRDARAREAELTLAERRAPAVGHAGRWADWVPDYLASRYRGNAKSHARYISIWKNLQPFLREHDLETPRALTREHAFRFFRWRQQRHPGIRPAAHNTAILELKILGMLCKEAIRRGYTTTNPVADLGLKKIAPQKKPALRPEHFTLIEAAIESDASPWKTLIERAYLIARHQGIRINETWINPQTH